ncbi:MAG TPA: phospholipase D-like domain-containing protein [Tepidisphaeraceae bacterium]
MDQAEASLEAIKAAGVNVMPGSEDDGWEAPSPVTLDDGTIVQLFKDGEALHAAYGAIESAKRRVCLEFYIFASDETGRAFADLLCRKASEGLKVFVIYDSFGSIGSDSQMFRQMRRAGVRLEEFNPMAPWKCRFGWRPVNRDHRKLLIIDDEIAGLGGLNVGHQYAGSWVISPSSITGSSAGPAKEGSGCDFWRDNAIGLKGPAARYLLRSFAKTWHYVTHGGRIRNAAFNYNLEIIDRPTGGDDMGILASVPTLDSPLRDTLRKLLSGAKESIQMTMAYFAPDDDLIEALCSAAQRGVKVQLMLPAVCDVRLLLVAARSFYERLLTAGVEIYERQTVVLHAKTMTIDGRLTVIGSTNLDYRSIEYNLELSAIVRSEEFGRDMQELFANDMHFAKRITLKQWRRRPRSDRIVQWAVSRARYLL